MSSSGSLAPARALRNTADACSTWSRCSPSSRSRPALIVSRTFRNAPICAFRLSMTNGAASMAEAISRSAVSELMCSSMAGMYERRRMHPTSTPDRPRDPERRRPRAFAGFASSKTRRRNGLGPPETTPRPHQVQPVPALPPGLPDRGCPTSRRPRRH